MVEGLMTVWLNGVKYELASCWEKVKTKHYQELMEDWDQDKPMTERNYFKLFCILTGTDFKEFHATAENEVTIWNAIQWVTEQPFEFSKEPPKFLQIGEKIIQVPEQVELLSIGQNIHLKDELYKLPRFTVMKDGKPEERICLEAGISIATAIFLQPVYNEAKFDFKKALELKAIIDEMPAYLIYPIGFFLLLNALPTGTSGQNGSKNQKPSLITGFVKTLRGWLTPKDLPLSRAV